MKLLERIGFAFCFPFLRVRAAFYVLSNDKLLLIISLLHVNKYTHQVFPKKHSRKLGGSSSASTDKLPYFSKLFNAFL